MVRYRELPLELRGRAFTTDEARTAGLSRSRTRARDLEAPYRGVRSPISSGVLDRCAAYAVRMPETQHFSHTTAALLLGLPLPPAFAWEGGIHVTSVGGRGPRVRGVIGHLARVAEVSTIDGLRVSSALSTWCALAAILGTDDLVVVADALVRRRAPFATPEELAEAVAGHRGRRGARRLAAALTLVRPGTDSPRETRLRLRIVGAGLPEPLVNLEIRDAAGRFLALGDLVYPEYRILIEYDGGHHFDDPVQVYRDIDRLDAVMELGWRVIRVNRTHADHVVLSRIRTALLAAGWRP